MVRSFPTQAPGTLPPMPANAAFPFLDWPGPLPFAHAGGALEAPANTMPAFEHAVRLGYRYLETDVHVTADGELLAFHDDRLDRVTDGTGVIAELPWSTVKAAKVDGREPIPRFEDLLTAWPDVRINVDPSDCSYAIDRYNAGEGAASGFAIAGGQVILAKSHVGRDGRAEIQIVPDINISVGNQAQGIRWWQELQ